MKKCFTNFVAPKVKFGQQQLINQMLKVLQNNRTCFVAATFNEVKNGKTVWLTTVFNVVNLYVIVLYLMW